MTPESLQAVLVPIVVALIGGFVGFKGHGMQKGTRENRLIDQLQEEMESLRADVNGLKEERLKAIRREHIRDDYINALRRHIDDQKGPPSPPWPPTMYE